MATAPSGQLLLLPPGFLELVVCSYLDPSSLARLSGTTHTLRQDLLVLDSHWKAHVTRRFGFSHREITGSVTSVCWKDVFVAALQDSKSLSTAQHAQDVLHILHTHSTVLLGRDEATMRQELVLMQGLRRFPLSMELLRIYAQRLRRLAPAMLWEV